MKEFIPIKWLEFEKMLSLKNFHKWITIEQAKQIAGSCQIHDNQEFKTALQFLHDQRFLMYFDKIDELKINCLFGSPVVNRCYEKSNYH